MNKTPTAGPPAAGTPAEAPPETVAAEDEFDPTFVPTPKWLPDPIAVAEAAAETEAEMKPYTEQIAETDETFDMVPIPGGKFMMGSSADEPKRNDDEGPQHEVVIEPFWMGKCEVTWNEYELWGLGLDQQRRMLLKKEPTERDELVDAITRPTKPYSDMTSGMGKDGYPAICMSQLAARAYCKWLSAKTGRYYRLPTEAEWEYACRAGTTTAYSFGDDAGKLDEHAWHFANSDDAYHKVGLKKPNPWGLYDMHGNVSEWVLDQYVPDYYKQSEGKTTTRPLAPATTIYPRVARGGCWDDDSEKLRSAARVGSTKDWNMQDPQIPQSIWYHTEVYCPGFRVVRPLRVPDVEESKLYEPDYRVIKEYKEAQAGKQ
ncbi:MAG: sulfatase-modifying factor protein [Planctomycetes bacterium RBG_13_63_9]|nr:MAG: sulfatase-modifying factor protein [Planctomycetes bacterium RBG_13_63_9]